MKKFYLLLTAIAALFVTSCANEPLADDIQVSGAEGIVNFSVEAPEFGSRTMIGNGLKATHLVYAVYDNQWNYLTEGTATFQNLVANVSLRLVNNKEYNFVFWASVEGNSYYTLDTTTATVTVSYAGKANDENRDAFFGQLKGLVVNGTMNESVKLYRPFAQVNWGTNDVADAKRVGFDITKTSGATVTYTTKAYTTLDLKEGAVSGLTDVAFEAQTHVSNSYVDETGADELLKTKAGNTYHWVSMNYLLWSADQGTLDVNKIVIEDGKGQQVEVSYPNANVRRNWRTNLVGALLTDQANITVEIVPGFDDQYDVEVEEYVSTSVTTTAQLEDAINNATAPLVITLGEQTRATSDLVFEFDEIEIPSGKDITIVAGEGVNATLNGQFFVTGRLQIEGVTLSNEKATTEGISKKGGNAIYVQTEGYLAVRNSTFEVVKATGITSWWSTGKGTNVVVENCVFNCHGNRPLQIESNATITGCTFNDPYRYAAQLTCSNAIVNFHNNTLTQSTTSGKPTYGLQLTSDYGNSNLVINGSGNTIEGKDATDALYVYETGTGTSNGFVDLATIEFNLEDGKLYQLDGDSLSPCIASVEDLQKLAEEVNAGNNYKGKTVVLVADLDLAGISNWTPIGIGSAHFQGSFDGANHTIKNLKIDATSAYVGLFGYARIGVIKNLTIENADVKGTSFAAALCGMAETASFENITLKGGIYVEGTGQDIGALTGYTYGKITDVTVDADYGSYVKGASYFGGVVGYAGEGSTVFTRVKSNINVFGKTYMVGGIVGLAQYGVTFTDCECSGDVSLLEGDPASANRWMRIGGIAGSWMENNTYAVTLTNCSYTGKLFSQKTDGTVATKFDYDGLVGRGYNADGTGKLIIDGKAAYNCTFVTSAPTTVDTALVNGGDVVLSGDVAVDTNSTTGNSGYGATGVAVKEGELDLNGNTLSVSNSAWGTWDCVVTTTGGTIKNGTIKGAMRGIFMGSATADVYIDNIVLEDVVYTFNSDGGSKEYGVYISNTTLNGWTSFSDVHKEVIFTSCKFGKGSGYAFCRPYQPTVFKNCEFAEGFQLDGAQAKGHVFENCTLGGVALTSENIATLVYTGAADVIVK